MRLWRRNGVARKRVYAQEATAEDDRYLRGLLRDTPMPGSVALTLQREPNFFLASTIEGYRHETILGRDRVSERVIGLASRAVRDAWVNGETRALGYLSQLRVARDYRRSGSAVGRGFRLIRELHERDDTPYYITTIAADNHLARIVLEKDRSYKPNYRRKGVLSSLALPIWRARDVDPPAGVRVEPATSAHLEDIAACLQRNYARYQFAPHWTAEDLACPERTRGLNPEDFFVAIANGKIVGCVALWDQQAFKQTVVHGYSGWLAAVRHATNALAPVAGWPALPEPGEPLPHAFLSHFAVDDDQLQVGQALLQAGYNAALQSKCAFVVVGFDRRNPFYAVVKSAFRCMEYRTHLYLAFYPEAAALAAEVDGRIPHVEAAVL